MVNGNIAIPEFTKNTNPFACFHVKFNESRYRGLKMTFARKLHRLSIDPVIENKEPETDILEL